MPLIFARAAIVSTAVTGVLAATGGVASAGSPIHTAAVVPGTTNCVGLTAAFVLQGNVNTPGTFGLGNVAPLGGISVKQAPAETQFSCATGIVP